MRTEESYRSSIAKLLGDYDGFIITILGLFCPVLQTSNYFHLLEYGQNLYALNLCVYQYTYTYIHIYELYISLYVYIGTIIIYFETPKIF